MTNDQYLDSQLQPLLQPGEQVLQRAYMVRAPGLAMQILFVGGLLLFLITKAYFVVITNRRMILIRTKMGFWGGGPKQLNLGVEQHDVRGMGKCTVSGFANNRSMTFHQQQGSPMTLRISPWNKRIVGTAMFLEQVPTLINSGQLAALAAGGSPMPELPGSSTVPVAQAMAPAPHYAAPAPTAMHGHTFAPGTQVVVLGQDGNRYAAIIAQAAPGQYLCNMADGKGYWIPAASVSPQA